MTNQEAKKLALEALINYGKSPYIKQSHPKRWANGNKAIKALEEALAEQEQGEPDELKHIAEHDCLLDVDEKAWKALVENRGGCRCFLSPPCGACSNPISEEEMNEVGYTYTTPQQCTWVGLNWSDVPDEWVGKPAFMEGAKWAENKLKEKNT